MASLTRWCIGHRYLVIVGWIIGLAVLGGLNRAAGTAYTDFAVPAPSPWQRPPPCCPPCSA
jgi:hypothetical protein